MKKIAHNSKIPVLISLIIACICLITALSPVMVPASEITKDTGSADESRALKARPSVNGRLHVDGPQLVDEAGEPVVLNGVSAHGIVWYQEFIDEGLFKQVSGEWDANLVRLPVYSQLYSKDASDRELSLEVLKKGIEAAIKADMYVIVDWHILEDSDPNDHYVEAKDFFEQITAQYKDCPNLIFEICNEPNGETTWGDVAYYAGRIIPVIRENIPDSLILVGTPEYSRNLSGAIVRPLDFDNVMYVMHFYAASHGETLMGELEAAVEHGLPVFISECGLTESSGDGEIDYETSALWFDYLNKHNISYAIWNLSDKGESSAFFRHDADVFSKMMDDDLTPCGKWVRYLLLGNDPYTIPIPQETMGSIVIRTIYKWATNSLGDRGYKAVLSWYIFALIGVVFVFVSEALILLSRRRLAGKQLTYDAVMRNHDSRYKGINPGFAKVFTLLLSSVATIIYLCWRIKFSIPFEYGAFAVICNIILFIVEVFGFVESLILFHNLMGLKKQPLPEIPEESWPDVDIFIATYNEPVDLLQRTVNGCVHLKYPDKSKVHVWICDDNRRPEMRALAERMGVGYFDRPDNEGAKAGNLNNALHQTSAPYVVTLDADMIPKSDFLLKTIPYFVNFELCQDGESEEKKRHLGLLQTPQCFYEPDVFQYALYSEKRAPNEQDFFYRTIEPAKASTNSVIYGGSNTVLSRLALEKIGGFYTGSITEDFATGLLIESEGFVSLATAEPLASGQTPHTYKEHIQQRVRWGRGVISTVKSLGIWKRKELSLSQKFSYWSSKSYWYSPVKSWIYIISPLLFAVAAVPVFKCNWLELLVFWLPMFFLQDLALKVNSDRAISVKWSSIYEISVMPKMLIPIIKESLGMSLKKFKVTDKSGRQTSRDIDYRSMVPFIILSVLCLVGIIRLIVIFDPDQSVGLIILLFWLIRNLYFLVMAIFLVDGRDNESDIFRVVDAIPLTIKNGDKTYEGVTTTLTEHYITVFADESETLQIGDHTDVSIIWDETEVKIKGVVTDIMTTRNGRSRAHRIEILDFGDDYFEYLEVIYDRVPSLPQSLQRDFGIIPHMWQNIACRVARTTQ